MIRVFDMSAGALVPMANPSAQHRPETSSFESRPEALPLQPRLALVEDSQTPARHPPAGVVGRPNPY